MVEQDEVCLVPEPVDRARPWSCWAAIVLAAGSLLALGSATLVIDGRFGGQAGAMMRCAAALLTLLVGIVAGTIVWCYRSTLPADEQTTGIANPVWWVALATAFAAGVPFALSEPLPWNTLGTTTLVGLSVVLMAPLACVVVLVARRNLQGLNEAAL